MSSQVSTAETTTTSTKGALGKGTDISTGAPILFLANLGAPKAPAAKDVRHYLHEFLSGQRIIEMLRLV